MGVTLQLLQFKITLWGWVVQWGNGTVTHGVSNPNDRFGGNGTVATVAVAQGCVSNPVEEPFWGRCEAVHRSEPKAKVERRQSEGRKIEN